MLGAWASSDAYMISPRSSTKRLWEYLGLLLLITQLLFEGFDTLCDVYFMVDLVVRFRTGYINNKGNLVLNPKHVARRYLKTWFFFDIVVSLPYQIIWRLYNARPLHKLLEIRNHRRPLFNFIFNRKFRVSALQAINEHLDERKWLQELLLIDSPRVPLARRVVKWIGVYIRGRRYVELVKNWGALLRALISIVISLRAVSIFSSVFCRVVS